MPETLPQFRLYSVDEVATMFQCGRAAVDKLVKEGRLRPVKIGTRHRFTMAELERFINTPVEPKEK